MKVDNFKVNTNQSFKHKAVKPKKVGHDALAECEVVSGPTRVCDLFARYKLTVPDGRISVAALQQQFNVLEREEWNGQIPRPSEIDGEHFTHELLNTILLGRDWSEEEIQKVLEEAIDTQDEGYLGVLRGHFEEDFLFELLDEARRITFSAMCVYNEEEELEAELAAFFLTN